ncbi:MAG: hypothetical protein ABI440_05685 [Casimicrobiaceae bacterium]
MTNEILHMNLPMRCERLRRGVSALPPFATQKQLGNGQQRDRIFAGESCT